MTNSETFRYYSENAYELLPATTCMPKTGIHKYQMVSFATMNAQVNVRMPSILLKRAEQYAKKNGYANVQEVMREVLRETVMLSANDLRALREAKEDEREGRTVQLS